MSEAPRLQTITDLCLETGHRMSRSVEEATRVASAIQRQRLIDGVGNREGITRSSLLLALMYVDRQLDEALSSVGVNRSKLASLLKLAGTPRLDADGESHAEPELAEAVTYYLRSLSAGYEVGTADLAAAILSSAEREPDSQIAKRCRRLGVNYPATFAVLKKIGGHVSIDSGHSKVEDIPPNSDFPTELPQVLGTVNNVDCFAVVTSRPWLLDVDALVVSAAPSGGLGNLGRAVRKNVPGVAWPEDEFYSLSPDEPQVLPVSPSADVPGLRQVIVASARDGGRGTPDAAGRGMASAVRAAVQASVKALAVPLLGAGAMGLPLDTMAAVNVRAVGRSLRERPPSPLQRVLFVGLDQHTVNAIQMAWRTSGLEEAIELVVPGETSNPASGDDQITDATLLAGGMSGDLVDGEQRIPLTDDHLGLGTYVAMLATLIARRDTPMPLSIGLFGEWGSGKSYFMGLLRGKVHELARSGDEAYVSEVVPISFNAWHYSDTNLWASLGNEIFEQLAGPQATPAKHREALREELAVTLRRTQALKLAKAQAVQETAQLGKKLEKAQRDAAGSATALVSAVANSEILGKELKTVWTNLGIVEEVDKVQLLTNEIRGAGAELSALKMAASGRKGVVATAWAVTALVLIAASAFFRDDVANWVAGGGVGALAGALASMSFAVQRAREGLRSLHSVAEEIRQQTGNAADKQVAKELQLLREAEAREAVLQSQLAEVLQRAGQLGLEIAALHPAQQWYDFVSERAGSEEYSDKLGMISTIRKDFERLIGLMREWRTLNEPHQHKPIDRIVLYIDDLDRCSPRQVVDVLQAVHLLLALDLFVVVVGVDPRWLLHSLREQYASVFPGRTDGNFDAAEERDAEADWRTTPQDYLEKIFNIPFVLPGMTGTTFERLIRELSLGREIRDPPDNPQPDVGGKDQETNGGDPPTPDSFRIPSPGPSGDFTAETGSEAAAALDVGPHSGLPKVEPRRLTEDELKLLAALGPLVRSPRQAKRLLNLYRLVRSTRDLSPAADFLGNSSAPGQFQAVAVLLGLLTTHPRLLGQLIAALRDEHSSGGPGPRWSTKRWDEVVEGLRPRKSGDRWSNDISGDLSDADRREWDELVQGVGPATALVTLPDLTAFQIWGPKVTRFSFVLSPLAVQDQSLTGKA